MRSPSDVSAGSDVMRRQRAGETESPSEFDERSTRCSDLKAVPPAAALLASMTSAKHSTAADVSRLLLRSSDVRAVQVDKFRRSCFTPESPRRLSER